MLILFRLTTVVDADVVMVMDDGELVEIGSPEKLLFNFGSRFHELALSVGVNNLRLLQERALSGFEISFG
jgi:ABC-type glutathione transport system ATPase component